MIFIYGMSHFGTLYIHNSNFQIFPVPLNSCHNDIFNECLSHPPWNSFVGCEPPLGWGGLQAEVSSLRRKEKCGQWVQVCLKSQVDTMSMNCSYLGFLNIKVEVFRGGCHYKPGMGGYAVVDYAPPILSAQGTLETKKTGVVIPWHEQFWKIYLRWKA